MRWIDSRMFTVNAGAEGQSIAVTWIRASEARKLAVETKLALQYGGDKAYEGRAMEIAYRSGGEGRLSVKEMLMCRVAEPGPHRVDRVTVVGAGQVGMACASSLLMQGVVKELILVGRQKDKVKGEMLDLRHGSVFMLNPFIYADSDYAVSANSRLIVVTVGARRKPGESRLALVQKNADMFKKIIPDLVKHSPDCILLIVTNPVDVMTYVAWKVSGLPTHKVIGSGTSLDSSRFRYFIAKRLDVRATSVHSWIIGEHGDSCVPVWSGVNVSGVRLRELYPALGTPDDEENWNEVHEQVIKSGSQVIKMKGYTSWAIALSVSALARSILYHMGHTCAVSTAAKGYYGIDKDVFLSLPCVLGENGISNIIKLPLTEEETCRLKKSADVICEVQSSVQL